MPFYAVAMVFQLNTYLSYHLPRQLQWILLALVFVSTFVFPALFASFLVQKGIVSSLKIENQKERRIPFIATALFYFISFFMIKRLPFFIIERLPLPDFFSSIILGGALLITIAFLINLKWKVSIHMLGIGGLCGFAFWLIETKLVHSELPFLILLLISGLVVPLA